MSDPGPTQLLGRLLGPPGPELTCVECFDELDRYVELEMTGRDADAMVPGMRAHLDGCRACREDHEGLAALLSEPVTRDVRVKRIYDEPAGDDGYRVLIDHVWPRGVSHERARLDDWARDVAPSDDLRRWFAHDPAKFPEFRARYRDELLGSDAFRGLAERAARGPVTLLYAARDRAHNNAVVVAELLFSTLTL